MEDCCYNSSFDIFLNDTFITENSYTLFELKIAVLIGVTFTITLVVGIIGNSLVFLTILLKKQMRSTTNILILNLAIAELLFILLCVPFTGLNYVLSVWHFGDKICRIVQVINTYIKFCNNTKFINNIVKYTSNVTAYVIILLLVYMSFDRYLAISIIGGSAVKTTNNAVKAVIILWIIVLILNVPHLFLWEEHSYNVGTTNRTICILKYNIIRSDENVNQTELAIAEFKVKAYYTIFFIFGYLLPFVSIFIIYGLIILKLNNNKGQAVNKGKRRILFMVIAVVSSFVLCWGRIIRFIISNRIFHKFRLI